MIWRSAFVSGLLEMFMTHLDLSIAVDDLSKIWVSIDDQLLCG